MCKLIGVSSGPSNKYSLMTGFVSISTGTLTLSLLAATWRLLITLANSLDPDLDRQNIGSDLDSNCLTL